jgi:hypothetical protein
MGDEHTAQCSNCEAKEDPVAEQIIKLFADNGYSVHTAKAVLSRLLNVVEHYGIIKAGN